MPAMEPTVPTAKMTPAAPPTGHEAEHRCTMSGVAIPSAQTGTVKRSSVAARDWATKAGSAVSWVYSSGPASHAQTPWPTVATRRP